MTYANSSFVIELLTVAVLVTIASIGALVWTWRNRANIFPIVFAIFGVIMVVYCASYVIGCGFAAGAH